MKKSMLIGVFALFCVFTFRHAGASHIVGGEITYKHKGGDTFEVTLLLFVDCINGQPGAIAQDQYASIGIFRSDNTLDTAFYIEREEPVKIDDVNYKCIEPPSNACVDMYSYKTDVILEPDPEGYVITFQRCCRNNTINNIIRPDSTGATYFVAIPGTGVVEHNSSAVFKALPPNFLCVNEKFDFDHSATDPDGDSLVYELYTPYVGATVYAPRPVPPGKPPYQEVIWQQPFNLGYPLGTTSTFKIDSHTGVLSLLPRQQGQFAVGIGVKEYRDGMLISTSRRDYQFNVLPCQLEVYAKFVSPGIYCKPEVPFINKSKGDSFLWDFGVPGVDSDTSTLKDPVFTYPSGDGNYTVTLVAMTGNCMDTVSHKLTVRDPGGYHFVREDTTVCIGEQVQLSLSDNAGVYSYYWTPDTWLDDPYSPTPTTTPHDSITYTVVKKYMECSYTDSVTIRVLSPRADLDYEIIPHCDSIEVRFSNLTTRADAYEWMIGDKVVSVEAAPVLYFPYNTRVEGWLTATSEGICSSARKRFSFDLDNLQELGLYVPNVITPNNDGFNDCFEVAFKEINLHCLPRELKIFNRWGQLVWDEEDLCWNGIDRSSGKPLPDGTYYFVLKFVIWEYHGTVNISR